MFKNLKKQSKGFTIIEVMIVLAVAGLIMLIVFLAVPSLQRSQRNTSRKSDAARVSTAVINFYANNGRLPASQGDVTSIANDAGTLAFYGLLTAAGTAPATGPAASGKLSLVTVTSGALALNDAVQIGTAMICDSTVAGGATTTGASARNVTLQYALEAGSGVTPVCINVQ